MAILSRLVFPAALGIVCITLSTTSRAALLSDTLTFETQDQGMWSSGPPGSTTVERFIGVRWGRYRDPVLFFNLFNIPPPPDQYTIGGFVGGETRNACVGVETSFGCAGFRTDVDTTTGVEVEYETSGRVGVFAGAELSGGGIDVNVPVNATITLPDQVNANEFFQVSTTSQTVASGAKITADAPSFRAYVDGAFDIENKITAEGCALGACAKSNPLNVDLNLGRFDILEVDSSNPDPWSVLGVRIPGLPTFEIDYRAPNPATDPDGIEQTPNTGPNFNKKLAELTVLPLVEQSGGAVSGNNLVLNTSQDLLEGSIFLINLLEAAAFGPGPGILANDFTYTPGAPIPSVGVEYALASIEVGPVLAVESEYDFDPKAAVRLQFDMPVTRMENRIIRFDRVCDGGSVIFGACVGIGAEWINVPVYGLVPIKYDDGFIEIVLGEDAMLMFEDGVGQLLDRTYFLQDPMFRNSTSVDLDFFATAEFGCLTVTGLGDGCLVSETVRGDLPFTGNADFTVDTREFILGGFNEVQIAESYRFNNMPGGTDGTTSVPEPATLPLLLFGMIAVLGVASRTRQSKRGRHMRYLSADATLH